MTASRPFEAERAVEVPSNKQLQWTRGTAPLFLVRVARAAELRR